MEPRRPMTTHCNDSLAVCPALQRSVNSCRDAGRDLVCPGSLLPPGRCLDAPPARRAVCARPGNTGPRACAGQLRRIGHSASGALSSECQAAGSGSSAVAPPRALGRRHAQQPGAVPPRPAARQVPRMYRADPVASETALAPGRAAPVRGGLRPRAVRIGTCARRRASPSPCRVFWVRPQRPGGRL
jgi:hypothetical protein